MALSEVLAVSSDPTDLKFAEALASAASLQIRSVDSLKDAVCHICPEGSLILLDVTTLQKFEEFKSVLLPMMSTHSKQGKILPRRVHFITDHSPASDTVLEQLETVHSLYNFVLRNTDDPEKAGAHYGHLVQNLNSGRTFGLENIVGPSFKSAQINLKHSTEREGVLDAIASFLAEIEMPERAVNLVCTAVDELLMNAIYDAPVDDKGNPELAKVPRNTPVPLVGKREVELQMGANDKCVGFSVLDRHGSLDRQHLITALLRSFKGREYVVRDDVAGAGLGLSTTLKSGGSLVFVTEPGQKTEVTVFFWKTPNVRALKKQFRFVSIHTDHES